MSYLKKNNQKRIEDLAIRLASEMYKLHCTKCEDPTIPSRKAQINKIAHDVNGYKRHTRDVILTFLNEFEETNTLLFGDFKNNSLDWIKDKDLEVNTSNLAFGNPVFDLAAIYYLCTTFNGRYNASKLLHLSYSKITRFWDAFIISYASLSDRNINDIISDCKDGIFLYYAYMIEFGNHNKNLRSFLYSYYNWIAEEIELNV